MIRNIYLTNTVTTWLIRNHLSENMEPLPDKQCHHLADMEHLPDEHGHHLGDMEHLPDKHYHHLADMEHLPDKHYHPWVIWNIYLKGNTVTSG